MLQLYNSALGVVDPYEADCPRWSVLSFGH